MYQSRFKVKITSEQETLLLDYHKKWFDLDRLTGPTNLRKIEESVNLAYSALGKQNPKITFCESPYQAMRRLYKWENQPMIPLMSLGWQLRSQLPRAGQLGIKNRKRVVHPDEPLGIQLRFALIRQFGNQMADAITTSAWFGYTSWFDFCISVLNCPFSLQAWEALQSVVRYCSFIFPFETTCLVIDRPVSFSLDELERFHIECKPAAIYADGFGLYFYHGIGLPEEYGQLPTQEWRVQWLFQESDSKVRRALLHGIGYRKICEELQVVEIDSLNEYSLLRVENTSNNAISLPIILLKRINSNTGRIQIVEAPLHSETVREAMVWVNKYWFIEDEDDCPST
jgi:hypothetical protein